MKNQKYLTQKEVEELSYDILNLKSFYLKRMYQWASSDKEGMPMRKHPFFNTNKMIYSQDGKCLNIQFSGDYDIKDYLILALFYFYIKNGKECFIEVKKEAKTAFTRGFSKKRHIIFEEFLFVIEFDSQQKFNIFPFCSLIVCNYYLYFNFPFIIENNKIMTDRDLFPYVYDFLSAIKREFRINFPKNLEKLLQNKVYQWINNKNSKETYHLIDQNVVDLYSKLDGSFKNYEEYQQKKLIMETQKIFSR